MNRFYQFAIILLIVALAWSLTEKKCSKDTPTIITKIDTVLQDSQETTQKMAAMESNMQQMAMENELQRGQLKTDDARIKKANKTATQLANDLFTAKQHHDTVAYERICDSLGNAAVQWEIDYNKISDSAKKAFAITDSISKRKDEMISLLDANRLRLIATLQEAKRAIEPRRKVLLGVEGYSSPTAFQSLQVGILFQDKVGNTFGASGGFQFTGQPVFGAKYYRTIQFHK